MKNCVFIATSLDGYIAGEGGDLDWLMSIPNPDNNDYGFNEFMDKVDGIIMGRKTYEKVISFGTWPYTKIVFILSTTLKDIPEGFMDKVEILNGEIPEILDELNKRGYKNLYIDGGKTIQSFLRLNLIDEMIITQVPILLGEGISLFGYLDKVVKFKVEKTEKVSEYFIQTHYIKE